MTESDSSSADTAPAHAPAIVLVEPQLGENIGAAARAMANFGLQELRLVNPRDGWPNNKAFRSASGAAEIVEQTQVFTTLEDAVADFTYVLATTARRREMVKPVLTPASAAREMRGRAAGGERVGILFGRERWGLENDEVALADALVMAPVNPAFASLNLAQAVLLIGYEWHAQGSDGSLGRETSASPAGREGLTLSDTRPATKAELIGLFEHLERELDRVNFLRPLEKRPAMVRNLRNLAQRQALTEQDVRALRGVIAALVRGQGRPPRRTGNEDDGE